MEHAVNEYVRIMRSLSLGETEKNRLSENIMRISGIRKDSGKKQIAVASAVAVAAAVCVSFAVKTTGKLK